jgi:hypothetical protein
MKKSTLLCSLLCLLVAPALAAARDLDVLVSNELSGLVDTYKGIHAHPELSHHEEHTAALLASELRKAGYTVTERVESIRTALRPMGSWRCSRTAPARDC